jgi:hypothetical protein
MGFGFSLPFSYNGATSEKGGTGEARGTGEKGATRSSENLELRTTNRHDNAA